MMMGGMGGMGGGTLGLLMMKEVREELNLDEDQNKELEDMGKAMMESFASMRPQQGQAPDPKMMQEAMEKVRKAATEAEEKLSDILDPKQTERLIGLVIQRDSIRAINSKLVADKLGITSEQKEKMASMEKENMEKMREMFQGGGGGFSQEMRDKMRAFREESETKMKEILTSAQKDQMESLKGAEFKFPEPQWGRGGPGGGRGGPGGGRGGRGGAGGDGQS